MPIEKFVYLLWSLRYQSRAATRDLALGDLVPRVLETEARQLSLDIVDPESRMPSPAPGMTLDPPPVGLLNVWVDDAESRRRVEAALGGVGLHHAGYRVDETVYADYGDNRHASPRDWPDGQRSPGVTQVTLLTRPPHLTQETWLGRWHGNISPVSEAIQPRCRYVRDVIREAVTPGAPPVDGIVEEVWPSRGHVLDPFLYFGAKGPAQLARNIGKIVGAVTSFTSITSVWSVMMGEYFLRTDPTVPMVKRSPYDLPE